MLVALTEVVEVVLTAEVVEVAVDVPLEIETLYAETESTASVPNLSFISLTVFNILESVSEVKTYQ